MGKPKIDETGKKYFRLTVLEYVYIKNKWKWKCLCDCGNIVYVAGADLRRGHTKSCGCYQKEQTSKASLKDLTGQTFGKLYVLERDMHYTGKGVPVHWICKCLACGNITSVYADSLRNGQLFCGCINSKGEYIISLILNENKIKYKKEFTFDNYKNRRFDFALLNEDNQPIRLIEFDGIQHYYHSDKWIWNNSMTLEQQKERDLEKNQIASLMKIPLIRIPYWKLETLTITQLLDETFLV